jgi:hypothetical protein
MKSNVDFEQQDANQPLSTLLAIAGVTAFLSFNFLFDHNLGGGGWNEVDVIPLAKQFVQPSWLPQDWYLNQPGGYRVLFLAIAGWLTQGVGLLWTSFIGRLICYGMVATGCVWIGQYLNLRLPFLLVAIACFTAPSKLNWAQGVIAGEWLVGGLEAKSFAYGCLLMAIACLFQRRYRWMAVLLGVATSFHVLVGGWATFATLGWVCLHPKERFPAIALFLQAAGLYLLASAVAIPAVVQQLLSPEPDGAIAPSYIYVFWRLPHHLNPLGWSLNAWPRLVIYLILFVICFVHLKRIQSHDSMQRKESSPPLQLAEWTLMSLVPFGLGLAIAPLDANGTFLQYYPFRLGDVMLPFTTCLLIVSWFQQGAFQLQETKRRYIAWGVIGLLCVLQWTTFQTQARAIFNFPAAFVEEGEDWLEVCAWIQKNTPQDAIFLTPPESYSSFTWLAERAKVVDYKLLPQTKARIMEWYDRINDVTGDDLAWPQVGDRSIGRNVVREEILEFYDKLSENEVELVMEQYGATHVLMLAQNRSLDFPVLHKNKDFIVYEKPRRSPRNS